MEKRIADMGGYSLRVARGETEELNANPTKVKEVFKQLIIERLGEWISLADELASRSSLEIYMTGGNDDDFFIEPILKEAKAVINPDGRVVQIDELHEMISCPYSNLTPWKCPRDIPEDELKTRIEEFAVQVKDHQNSIFNFHVPPIDSGLDTCPKLDTSTDPPTPIIERGNVVMYNAGSTSVRSAIEKYHPLVSLHGHIHESRGVREIGRTTCFNPGSEYAEGILRGVIISLSDKKVGYQFTSG